MDQNLLLLGVDGGGTRCRARLCAASGEILAEAETGPANLRLGVGRSFASVVDAARDCLTRAGLPFANLAYTVACLALAGASEPKLLATAQAFEHPFRRAIVTTDAHAACIGAHGARDGGIIIAGTGTVGWAVVKGRTHRVGGWGLPLSDEGSGAWLGAEALRRVLWAADGRTAWTPCLRAVFKEFGEDAHAIVAWSGKASPRDFGGLAPRIVDYAGQGDAVALALMRAAGGYVDALGARLLALGAQRLALAGGLAAPLRPYLAAEIVSKLVDPEGDALAGALALALVAAQAPAQVA